MKKQKIFWIAGLSLIVLFSGDLRGLQPRPYSLAKTGIPYSSNAPYVPGQVLVQFLPDIPQLPPEYVAKAFGLNQARFLPKLNVYQLGVFPGSTVEETVSAWKSIPFVAYAEPNYIVHASITPNDPLFNQQYALSNAGGTLPLPGSPIGTAGADIKATAGWEESTGSEGVVVAVLDTGIDLLHPDLKDKVLSNGYNAFNDDLDASDDNGHGTAICGIIGAQTNNSEGIAGVAWDCKLLPVKVLDKDGVGTVDVVSKGIEWAADKVTNGVKVINISWGVDVPSNTLRDAIEYAYEKGVVIVAAAGNTGGAVEFPAAYDNYVLAVAATDYNDTRLAWSNTGSEIDVAAPGLTILSTVPRNFFGVGSEPYGYFTLSSGPVLPAPGSGTSFAAAHVSGLAALIASIKSFLSVDDIMDIIRFSADDINSDTYPGKDEFIGYGRINIEKAIVPLIITSAAARAAQTTR
jgi:thermitase